MFCEINIKNTFDDIEDLSQAYVKKYFKLVIKVILLRKKMSKLMKILLI